MNAAETLAIGLLQRAERVLYELRDRQTNPEISPARCSRMSLLPTRFLFRYSIPVQYEPALPRKGKKWLGLTDAHSLPNFGELDGDPPFGELRLAWNEGGLAVAVIVSGKRGATQCSSVTPDQSDGLQLWIDTRNTQSIHRASRFCHHFCLLPRGGGNDEEEPLAVQLPIARAKEETPIAEPGHIRLSADMTRDGYLLEAWIPSTVLHGYDPEVQSRLGFYYALRDAPRGEQTLSVSREFPFAADPSLWGTLELVK